MSRLRYILRGHPSPNRGEFWRHLSWHLGDEHASRIDRLVRLYCLVARVPYERLDRKSGYEWRKERDREQVIRSTVPTNRPSKRFEPLYDVDAAGGLPLDEKGSYLPCPLCGRQSCDHTPAERPDSWDNVQRFLKRTGQL